ncbi:hypothetical protein K435DRAFT_869882 [Dendrothele bispora CBS 962.96]|uniref:Uncharacterized protein n=1 Tax=Dendrothele bispora (strain CBS 962.96) TaxID=1314807 RepID=A0A4S8L8P8_DENBC|nr:hypothetical protein K435DRAFT_869882 [Dendrothele bispora CBS 962.96]
MSFGPPPNNPTRKASGPAALAGGLATPSNQTRITSHSLSHQNANESTPTKLRTTGPSSNVNTPAVSLKNVVTGSRSNKPPGIMNPQPVPSSSNSDSTATAPSRPNQQTHKDKSSSATIREDEAEEDDTPKPRSDTIFGSSPLTSFEDNEKEEPGVRTTATEDFSIPTSSQSQDKGKGKASGPTLEVPSGRKGFQNNKVYFHIFSKFKDVVPLFDEPIYSSISRYYAPFNHATDYDVLIPFGVLENGSMPGRSAEDSCLLRDAVIRWSNNMDVFPFGDRFLSVKDYALHFPSLYYDHSQLLELKQPDGNPTLFTVGIESLHAIGHMVLGLNQVLDSFHRLIPNS